MRAYLCLAALDAPATLSRKRIGCYKAQVSCMGVFTSLIDAYFARQKPAPPLPRKRIVKPYTHIKALPLGRYTIACGRKDTGSGVVVLIDNYEQTKRKLYFQGVSWRILEEEARELKRLVLAEA